MILASSFTLYFTVLYISLINRNCVLLYLCVYFYISVISLLYYWISDIYIYTFIYYISPLSFRDENNLDQSNLSRSNDLVKDHAALSPAKIWIENLDQEES
jgi:hypothetical protein